MRNEHVYLSLRIGSEFACVVSAVRQIIFLCIDKDWKRIPEVAGWGQRRLET